MVRLALFPLNTVLFPGMPLHLHIFEDRYKVMIGRCIEERVPFGVVLIHTGAEVEGFGPAAQPYLVGCTAVITQVQPLGDGRMNIVAVGHERFRITAQFSDEPYMTGDIEVLPLHKPDTLTLNRYAAELRHWVERYLQLLEKLENTEFDLNQLPKDPMAMIYLAASLLRVVPSEKQPLLAESSAVTMVEELQGLYKRETLLLEIMAGAGQAPQFAGPFSLN
jgi:Lon protease-like protein